MEEKKMKAVMAFSNDTRRFHRFRVAGDGLNGSLYFEKEHYKSIGTPTVVILESLKPRQNAE